jgi:hypothetical protein
MSEIEDNSQDQKSDSLVPVERSCNKKGSRDCSRSVSYLDISLRLDANGKLAKVLSTYHLPAMVASPNEQICSCFFLSFEIQYSLVYFHEVIILHM